MAASLTQVRSPGSESIKILKWKVRKDSTVTKGTVLALYEVQNNGQSTDPVKLKSASSGIVAEILIESGCVASPGAVLMTLRPQASGGCTHPTVMKDMCADCGADLRREPGVAGDRKEAMTASVAMVHNIPELIISQEQALELGREDEQRLLKTRKLVLLVDLDQTLIHTTNDNIPPNLKDVFHFQMWQGPHATWYHTRLRPHTRTFLERVSQMYELHICTFGVRLYAHTVARLIDPDERIFSHRILSRDECFDPLSKTANLKALFPCGDSMVCIIDDREDVWNFAPNLVHVKPYRFFQGTADINAPPGLTKMENDDVPITHKVIDHHHSGGEEQPKNASENEKEKQAPDKSDEEKDDRDASTAAGADLAGGDGDVVHKTDDLSSSNGKDGLKAESLDSPSQVAEAQAGECKMELSDSIPGVSEAQTGESVVKSEEESPAGDKEKTEISEGTENDAELREKDRREKELADDLRVSSESESDSESSNLNKEGASLKGDNSHTDQTKDANSKLLVSENKEPSDCDKAGDHADQTVNNGNVQKSPDHTGSSGSDGASTQQAESLSGKMEGSSTDAGEKNETDGTDVKKDGGDAGQASGGGDTVGAAADEGEAKDDEIEWDDEDDYLLHLEEILSRIHKAFYSMYDEGRERNSDQSRDASPSTADPSSRSSAGSASGGSPSDTTSSENTTKKLPDLKSIIPYVKRKTLKGCNVVFSGLVPLNIPVEKSRAYIVAKALGAAVQPEIVGPKDVSDKSKATTHLVAQKPGTSKHKTALRTRGIHIVNSGWLWACAERWERCDELLFPLGRDAKEESESPKKHKPRRGGRKRKSLDRDEEEGEDEEDSAGSEQKKQKRQDEEGDVEEGEMMQESSEAGADQISEGEMSLLSEKSATSTLNPLLSFSDEDLECMDKEVDELLAEEASDSSDETEGERNERMRKTVLGDQKDTESSSDSLSGEFPRGWGLRRKSSPPQTEDDLDKQKRKEVEVETEDTENEMISFQKTVDAFAPDSESNTSFAESIGSVDDEIADAVEKEFLASL